ncbi:magnesium/cobalt transporter CorA [soil metagenome]
MVNCYVAKGSLLAQVPSTLGPASLGDAVWIDLISPSKEEEEAVEALLGVGVPTPEEMREVQGSSQIYREGAASIMTIRVLSVSASPTPVLVAATFILTQERLVTLRYSDPTPFKTFVKRAMETPGQFTSSYRVMCGLLEVIVDRAAELLEGVGDELDQISAELFGRKQDGSWDGAGTDLQGILVKIGRNGDLASRARESLHSIARVVPVLQREQTAHASKPTATQAVDLPATQAETITQDTKSLMDHAAYLTNNVQFLLDSALGLINIQQNAIIKIFSVAAVLFLPPTLIASVYGMNFEHIPELKWHLGYPFALTCMVGSALVPYWYFKKRGWL